MMQNIKISAEDRQIYDSWLKILLGLYSPFGFLLLGFLIYGVLVGVAGEPPQNTPSASAADPS